MGKNARGGRKGVVGGGEGRGKKKEVAGGGRAREFTFNF